MKHLLIGILLSVFAVFAIYSWKLAAVIAFWFLVIRFFVSRSGGASADVGWTPDTYGPDPSNPQSTGNCDCQVAYGCDSHINADRT